MQSEQSSQSAAMIRKGNENAGASEPSENMKQDSTSDFDDEAYFLE